MVVPEIVFLEEKTELPNGAVGISGLIWAYTCGSGEGFVAYIAGRVGEIACDGSG